MRFDKWSIALRHADERTWTEHPTQKIFSSLLLSLIDTYIVRQFMLYTGNLETATEGILVISLPSPLIPKSYLTTTRSGSSTPRYTTPSPLIPPPQPTPLNPQSTPQQSSTGPFKAPPPQSSATAIPWKNCRF